MKAKKILKAKEVLKRYAAGERDFRGVNLRGQSFKGANLAGADFSGADIRSTNFSGSNLRGAKFSGAQAGLQKRWAILLTLISWLLAGISGLGSLASSGMISLIVNPDLTNKVVGWAGLVLLPTFLILIIRHGITIFGGLKAGAIISVSVLMVTIAALIAGADGATIIGALIVGVGFSAAAVLVGVGAGALAFAGAIIVADVIQGIIVLTIELIVAVGIEVIGAGQVGTELGAKVAIFSVVLAVPIALVVGVAGAYIGERSIKGDKRDGWIGSLIIAFAATGGTNFCDADLSDANFSSAKLKSTDLRKANLYHVFWYGAKMSDRVRPGDTYLKNSQLRQWLIGEGQNKNLDRQDLRGINLEGEQNLTDASFIKADLSGANLRGADLSRAKLVQTQLDDTDLTGATLTGAFIEDWGITSSTKLDSVKCEYVFMRLPPEKRPSWLALPVEQSLDPNPRRKPDNWDDNFEGNDFADFIKPIFDTLDLYHNQGVDPRAIAISWKELAENNPDANLRFASMEVKGENNLLLRLKTEPNADLSKLNAEYFSNYNQYKGLSENELRILLIEKTTRVEEQIKVINQYENMVETALNQNKSNYFIQGNMTMSEGNIYNTENAGIVHNEGQITGNAKVALTINEAEPKNLADAAQEIQQLLEQLSENYPTNTSKEKNMVVGEAVEQIEQNPRLKTKVINALKAGGIEAFKEAINHPLINIFLATIEGWQEVE